MNDKNDVQFYCKINPIVSYKQSRCYSWNERHFPELYTHDEYIPVFKNGTTDWIEGLDTDGNFSIILTLDSKRRNLCFFEDNFLVRKTDLSQIRIKKITDINEDCIRVKRYAFKIIEYTANLEGCYSPKSLSLLNDYRKMKTRISEEYIARRKERQ